MELAPDAVVVYAALAMAALVGALLFYRRRRGLVEQNQRFHNLMDSAPVLVWKSGTDKLANYFNRPWLEFTGRTLEQELGNGWADGVWSADQERCVQTYVSAFNVRQPFRMEYRLRRADGLYRWVLDTGVPLFEPGGGVFAGYIGSCIDITEAKEAADAVRENEVALQESERKVQDLAGRLIAAQDTERARIARDLHDDVSQQLAGLSIALSALRRRLLSLTGDERLRNDVVALQQRIITLAENVRHLSRDLHPDVLKHVGLAAALNAYCAEIQRQYGLSVTCAVEGSCDDITPAAGVCLYRVAQETLRNVVAHAAADRTEVHLIRTTDIIQLTIADDGRGFDIGHARAAGKGLGLVSVTERVRLAGGKVSLVTELNKGTRVCVQIPLGQSTSAAARARSARDEFMTSTPS